MGKHSTKTRSFGALATVAAGFVLLQVAPGAISNAVTEVWNFAKGEVEQSDSPVEFEVEADRRKLNVSPSQWALPLDAALPVFPEGSCEDLDSVAGQLNGAVA